MSALDDDVDYGRFEIDRVAGRIRFGSKRSPMGWRGMDLAALSAHSLNMNGEEVKALHDELVKEGYRFDSGFRNIRRVPGTARLRPTVPLSDMVYDEFSINSPTEQIVFNTLKGEKVEVNLENLHEHVSNMFPRQYAQIEDGLRRAGFRFSSGFRNISPLDSPLVADEPVMTRMGKVLSIDHLQGSVTLDGKVEGRDSPESVPVTISIAMAVQIIEILVDLRVMSAEVVTRLGIEMGAAPIEREVKVMPTPHEALAMVLKDISNSEDRAKVAADWLTRVTNGVTQILREEEEPSG